MFVGGIPGITDPNFYRILRTYKCVKVLEQLVPYARCKIHLIAITRKIDIHELDLIKTKAPKIKNILVWHFPTVLFLFVILLLIFF